MFDRRPKGSTKYVVPRFSLNFGHMLEGRQDAVGPGCGFRATRGGFMRGDQQSSRHFSWGQCLPQSISLSSLSCLSCLSFLSPSFLFRIVLQVPQCNCGSDFDNNFEETWSDFEVQRLQRLEPSLHSIFGFAIQTLGPDRSRWVQMGSDRSRSKRALFLNDKSLYFHRRRGRRERLSSAQTLNCSDFTMGVRMLVTSCDVL